MLLGICLVFEGVARQRWGLLLGASALIAVLVAIGLWAELPMITRVIDRSTEFGQAGSSASMRFVGGLRPVREAVVAGSLPCLLRLWRGLAGRLCEQGADAVAEMLLFKAVFEYGLLGGAAYLGFLGCCNFGSGAPKTVCLAVCVAILIGGMYTPFGHMLACGLLLWPRPAAADPPPREVAHG